jgi:hypothetical protein
VPSSDWTPDVARLGSLLRARTRDSVGNELGTFTPETRPTDAEAASLISDAVDDVASLIGTDIPPAVWDTAKYVSALGAALLVELSYFPEQTTNGNSPYDKLKTLYDERLKQLLKLVESDEAGGASSAGGGGLPGAPLEPVASFPVYPTGIYDPSAIGRWTRW